MVEENNIKKHIVIGSRLISLFNRAKGKLQSSEPDRTVTDEYVVLYLLNMYLEDEGNGRTSAKRR